MCLVGIERNNCQGKKKSLGHFPGTQQSNFQENTQALAFSLPFRIGAMNIGAFCKMEIFSAHEKMILCVAQMARPMATCVPCVNQSCECTNEAPAVG